MNFHCEKLRQGITMGKRARIGLPVMVWAAALTYTCSATSVSADTVASPRCIIEVSGTTYLDAPCEYEDISGGIGWANCFANNGAKVCIWDNGEPGE